MNGVFIEQDCTVDFQGMKLTSGGSWLADCSDGYRRGVVYVRPARHHSTRLGREVETDSNCGGSVTTWHGEFISHASFGACYRGNYCKMRSISFHLDGVQYTGRYCPDTSDACRVRSTQKVGA